MGTVRELLKRIESLKLREQVPIIIDQTKEEIKSLVKLQLYSGLDATGEKIKKKYSDKYYAAKKNRSNSAPGLGTPDLFLTGSFYQGLSVIVGAKIYTVESVDRKSDDLETKYGKQIFGLTQENKSVYAKGVVYEGIKAHIEIKTGLKLR